MKKIYTIDPWAIIEDCFRPEYQKMSESIFSIGNGRMGMRANFEESYSGKSLQGFYIGGVYYPDKTKVGWWKNGYPEYFAKVLNAPSWIGIFITINGITLDLSKNIVHSFFRKLDMKQGVLTRIAEVSLSDEIRVIIEAKRFISLVDWQIGAIEYSIKNLGKDAEIHCELSIDAGIKNQDANWDETFWTSDTTSNELEYSYIRSKTKKTEFGVCTGMASEVLYNNIAIQPEYSYCSKETYLSKSFIKHLKSKDSLTIYKYAAIVTTLHHSYENLEDVVKQELYNAKQKGFNTLLSRHINAWAEKW
ncbi:MAG: glycoside hydrolase family 65 protein, partial [Bacteroidales bacterium]